MTGNSVNQETEVTSLPYEDFVNIQLQEVDDQGVADIAAGTWAGDDPDRLLQRVQENVRKGNWWLQDEWRMKGLPVEEVVMSSPAGRIEVFNYNRVLEQRHLDELREVMAIFSQVNGGSVFRGVRYILIDHVGHRSADSGEEASGYGEISCKAIRLYPQALQGISHRVPDVTNFLGTLIHEFSHFLITGSMQTGWCHLFGWEYRREERTLPGGAKTNYWITQPERCVTSYATLRPTEDICDSTVAALKNPEMLDQRKRQFLIDNLCLPSLREASIPVEIKRLGGNSIVLPHVKQPVRYKVVKV